MKRILVLLSALAAVEAAVIAAPFLVPRLTARYLFPLYYRRGRPTRVGRLNNAAMSWLVSTGVLPEKWPGEPVCGPASLEVVGRRSGKPRTNMVTWVEYDGGRYFVSMLGADSDWVRNIRADPRVVSADVAVHSSPHWSGAQRRHRGVRAHRAASPRISHRPPAGEGGGSSDALT